MKYCQSKFNKNMYIFLIIDYKILLFIYLVIFICRIWYINLNNFFIGTIYYYYNISNILHSMLVAISVKFRKIRAKHSQVKHSCCRANSKSTSVDSRRSQRANLRRTFFFVANRMNRRLPPPLPSLRSRG